MFQRTKSRTEPQSYSILAKARVATITRGDSNFSLCLLYSYSLYFRWEAGPEASIKLKDHNFVLDIRGSKSDAGTPVIIYTPNHQANQKWTLEKVL